VVHLTEFHWGDGVPSSYKQVSLPSCGCVGFVLLERRSCFSSSLVVCLLDYHNSDLIEFLKLVWVLFAQVES